MKKLIYLSLLLISLCISLGGCTDMSGPDPPSTVGEIAFDSGYTGEHIVYIQENEEYVPYIVVTNDYQGLALLLREETLDIPRQFNPENVETASSYYPDSDIRIWLEDTFLYYLDAPVEVVKLEVTSQGAITHDFQNTEFIESKVFLLSATEVCFPKRNAFLFEGKELDFFKKMDEARITFSKDSVPTGWWLRTPNISKSAAVYSVSDEGIVGSTGIYTIAGTTLLSVRPAFCISADTKILMEGRCIHLSY